MKVSIFALLLLISAHAGAQDIGVNDISSTLDEMVKNNIISSHEAQKAKFQLKNSEKAFLRSTNRMPASVHSQLIDSVDSKDLSKVQIKEIEKDVDHIFKRAMER